ncbi:MAG: hypothetical protein IPI31_04845 [Bacteroidetes bacterium]|jgi:hypothetical protein|nr:hypothetical protein [Bacteroidota bacterium]
MKKLNLEIKINASQEKVWDAIVNVSKYRIWTAAFNEGSFFEGGWNKGDTIRFIGLNEAGEKEGMISEIAESIYPEFISIRHLGYIIMGVEDTTSDAVKKWAPSYENYTLSKIGDDLTEFKLSMDVVDEWYDMFLEMWPKAMAKLKEVAESNN